MWITRIERYNEEGVKVSVSLSEVFLFLIALALWVAVLWGFNITA
jgi:hypothetical protein